MSKQSQDLRRSVCLLTALQFRRRIPRPS